MEKDIKIKEKAKTLPASPGVYLMKDSLDNIIYIGKSVNLRSRVGSYFQNPNSKSSKVEKMVSNLKDFDFITTDTEFEALMLECKLIRQFKPAYNKLMKSPRSYCYIIINTDEKQPVFEISEEACTDGDILCFGPYTNRNTVKKAYMGIKECCGILCTFSHKNSSPCVNHSLGLCIGMCRDSFNRNRYREIIANIARLLEGTDESIIHEMEKIMESASRRFDFERAARYRDYIRAVNCLIGKVKVVDYTRKNRNIAVVEPVGKDSVKAFLIKGSRLLFSKKYSLKDYVVERIKDELKDEICARFGNKEGNGKIEIGKEEIYEAQIIYNYLNSKSCSCRHATIPEKLDDKAIDKKLDKLFELLSR